MDPGDPSLPEGWKIRQDKNKKPEHLTDRKKPTLEAKIEILDPGDYSLPPVKDDESVPKGMENQTR